MFYQNCGNAFETLKQSQTSSSNRSDNSIPPDNAMHLMKEDFESASLNTSAWRWVHETATVSVDATRSHRGQNSLRINTSNLNSNPWNHGFIETTRDFPLAGKSLFVRAFVYLDAPVPDRHFTVLSVKSVDRPPTAGTWEYRINLIPSGAAMLWRFLWNYGNVPSGQIIDSNPADGPQSGRWACWEWEFDGANRELHFWYDEVLVQNFTATVGSQWEIPKTVKAKLGFTTSHRESYGNTGYNIWLDDIAIDNKKIGCAN